MSWTCLRSIRPPAVESLCCPGVCCRGVGCGAAWPRGRELAITDSHLWHSSTAVIKKLPSSFTRLKKYVESFEHLLMLEIQAQVSGSIAEGATMSSVSCSIVSVLRRDEFWEVAAAVSSSNSVQVTAPLPFSHF